MTAPLSPALPPIMVEGSRILSHVNNRAGSHRCFAQLSGVVEENVRYPITLFDANILFVRLSRPSVECRVYVHLFTYRIWQGGCIIPATIVYYIE